MRTGPLLLVCLLNYMKLVWSGRPHSMPLAINSCPQILANLTNRSKLEFTLIPAPHPEGKESLSPGPVCAGIPCSVPKRQGSFELHPKTRTRMKHFLLLTANGKKKVSPNLPRSQTVLLDPWSLILYLPALATGPTATLCRHSIHVSLLLITHSSSLPPPSSKILNSSVDPTGWKIHNDRSLLNIYVSILVLFLWDLNP